MSFNKSGLKKRKGYPLIYVNVLLIGEAGAGKSTFINAFANYIAYRFIDKAETNKLITPISTEFNIKDEKNVFQKVIVNSDIVEKDGAGSIKTYVFPMGHSSGTKKCFRLIDTPGFGNKNNLEQDEVNCNKIFKYVSQLSELHAVCLLFKPTNSTTGKYSSNSTNENLFKYCLSQIFCYLEKSVVDNVFLVITHSKSIKGWRSSEVSENFLEKIKDFLPSFKSDYFLMENNVFKYLAALENNIKIDSSQKDYYQTNWKFSVPRSRW